MVTSDELELYKDREQSLIKHRFLSRYLELAAFKTLQGRSKIFNYVDAFAGPWNVTDDSEYSDSSFDRALKMLEGVRVAIARNGIQGLKIRFCLCEKRRDAVSLLKDYAAKRKAFEIHVFQGTFEENLNSISDVIPNGFTFTFIDPTGWKVKSLGIFEFLKIQKGEFLLNFMSDHINRHAEYDSVSSSIGQFLADPDWEQSFRQLPDYLSNEDRVLRLLKNKIKQAGAARFTPDFRILVPRSNRIKMRLILGTYSEKGLEVFRDVEAKVHTEQVSMRDQLKFEGEKQPRLFSSEQHAEIVAIQEGVGGSRSLADAEKKVLDLLTEKGPLTFRCLSCEVLEDISIRLTQLRDLMNDLKQSGRVHFDLPPKKKKPQEDTVVSLGKL